MSEFKKGDRVIVQSGPPDHGKFNGTITDFLSPYEGSARFAVDNADDAAVMIVTPDDPALRLWFTTGYDIGKAHWGQAVIPYPDFGDEVESLPPLADLARAYEEQRRPGHNHLMTQDLATAIERVLDRETS